MNRKYVLSAMAAGLMAVGSSVALADGDTLRIGHYDMPAQYGMPYGTFGANGALPLMAVYDAVTYVDGNGNTKPGLACLGRQRTRIRGCSSCAQVSNTTTGRPSTPRSSLPTSTPSTTTKLSKTSRRPASFAVFRRRARSTTSRSRSKPRGPTRSSTGGSPSCVPMSRRMGRYRRRLW